jgi:type I restriction enzyme S subunit
MKSNLPEGWAWTTLDALCSKISDGSHNPPKGREQGIPMLSAKNIQDNKIEFDEARLISEEDYQSEVSRVNISAGDVLLTIVGTIGRTAVVAEGLPKFSLQRSVAILKPKLDGKFLAYCLRTHRVQQYLLDNAKGTAQKGIYLNSLKKVPIHIPPLAEQNRIVAQLEAAMQKLEASQERLEKLPVLLKKFRQAVLAAAVSGKLTEAWRSEQQAIELTADVLDTVQHDRYSQARTLRAKAALEEIFDIVEDGQHFELPDTWQFVALDKVAESFNYGTSAKSANTGAVPVLRMGNLQGGQIDWTDLKYTSTPEEIEQYNLVTGDVLFNRTNSPELVGKTAIYRGEQPAIFAGYLIRVRTTPALNSEYLNYCLNSTYARQYCWNVKTDGVSQSNINAQKLSRFEVPFCSLVEQDEIVRQVNHYFNLADQLEARFEQAASLVEQLPQALLAKAFSGQLVPQDPNDEPASALLERLKTEAPAPANGKRGRKTTATAIHSLFD